MRDLVRPARPNAESTNFLMASFCITLPFVEFCSLCDQLQLDNQEWSERAKQDPTAQRILGVRILFTASYYALTTPYRATNRAFIRTKSSSWPSTGSRPLSSQTIRPSKFYPANVGPSINHARTLRLSCRNQRSTTSLSAKFPVPHLSERGRTSCRRLPCSSARTTNCRHTWRGSTEDAGVSTWSSTAFS